MEEEIIEAEVLDEYGRPLSEIAVPSGYDPHSKDHARPKGDTGGMLGGFLVLFTGFMMTLLVVFFSLFIVFPLMILGKLFTAVFRKPRA
jgi:hypothetical protein